MQGYHVDRKAGWDCHGLPVELAVEKELGFTGKDDIEAYGVAEFNARCRESVLRHVDAFEEMTERMGYWVDIDDPYRTMDPAYVESVWWALKQIYDKGLLVEDYRVAPYCPRCGTGLSDHELAQGYETVTDPSVYVRFPLTSGPYAGQAVAAGLDDHAVDAGLQHRRRGAPGRHLRRGHRRHRDARRRRAAARARSSARAGRCSDRFTGADMERWTYQRPFELVEFPPVEARHRAALRGARRLRHHRGRHRAGAPVPRVRRGRPRGLPRATACRWSNPVRPDGHFERRRAAGRRRSSSSTPTPTWSTTSRSRGLLFRHVAYEHSYPHCWRCHTALLYYAQPSWYVRTTAGQGRAAAREREDQLVPRRPSSTAATATG